MKQQQQQSDQALFQRSLYGTSFLQAQQAPLSPAAARPLNLGVRSFLDPGSRKRFSAKFSCGLGGICLFFR
jgi:hypothetical protein